MKKLYFLALLLVGAATPFSASAEDAWVKADKFCYKIGETVNINFGGDVDDNDAWVAYFRSENVGQTGQMGYDAWKYLRDCPNGVYTLSNLGEGSYTVVIYKNGGMYWTVNTTSFIVSNTPYEKATITPDKKQYAVTDPIVVNFENAPNYNNDRVAIVKRSTPLSLDCEWSYSFTKGQKTGEAVLNQNGVSDVFYDLPATVYYATMLTNGYAEVSNRVNIVVGEPITLTLDKEEYKDSENIIVNFTFNTPSNHFAPFNTDKVVVLDKDNKAVAQASVAYETKSVTLSALPAGNYQVCYTDGADLEISPRVNLSVIDQSGVEDIVVGNQSEKVIYNLQGVKMDTSVDDLPGGIYIINGKKVLVK